MYTRQTVPGRDAVNVHRVQTHVMQGGCGGGNTALADHHRRRAQDGVLLAVPQPQLALPQARVPGDGLQRQGVHFTPTKNESEVQKHVTHQLARHLRVAPDPDRQRLRRRQAGRLQERGVDGVSGILWECVGKGKLRR
jgi:hypothetical protein